MKLFCRSCCNSFSGLKLFDRVTIIYFSFLTLLIVMFRQNLQEWPLHFLAHLIIIPTVWIGGGILNRNSHRKWIQLFHYWYLPLFVTFIYWDCGRYIHLIYPGELDWVIQKLEWGIFGFFPNQWVQQFYNPVLNEIMQWGYGLYWFTIPVSTAILTWKKRFKEAEVLLAVTFSIFFISYLLFILFPVAGPRFNLTHLYTVPYTGLWLTGFLREFVGQAGLRGAAYPSSHVAVAISILFVMWYYEKKWAQYFFLPASIMLSLATVYGRYHYFLDMFSGLILGLLSGLLLFRYFSRIKST